MRLCCLLDILGTEDAVVEATSSDAVRFYPWTIDNKYYSAEVNLCVVPSKCRVTAEIAEAVQAFVVYFDSTQVSACLCDTCSQTFSHPSCLSSARFVLQCVFVFVSAPVEIRS